MFPIKSGFILIRTISLNEFFYNSSSSCNSIDSYQYCIIESVMICVHLFLHVSVRYCVQQISVECNSESSIGVFFLNQLECDHNVHVPQSMLSLSLLVLSRCWYWYNIQCITTADLMLFIFKLQCFMICL